MGGTEHHVVRVRSRADTGVLDGRRRRREQQDSGGAESGCAQLSDRECGAAGSVLLASASRAAEGRSRDAGVHECCAEDSVVQEQCADECEWDGAS